MFSEIKADSIDRNADSFNFTLAFRLLHFPLESIAFLITFQIICLYTIWTNSIYCPRNVNKYRSFVGYSNSAFGNVRSKINCILDLILTLTALTGTAIVQHTLWVPLQIKWLKEHRIFAHVKFMLMLKPKSFANRLWMSQQLLLQGKIFLKSSFRLISFAEIT